MDGGVLKFSSWESGGGESFLLGILLLMRLAVSVFSKEAFTLSTSASDCDCIPTPELLGMKGCFNS